MQKEFTQLDIVLKGIHELNLGNKRQVNVLNDIG